MPGQLDSRRDKVVDLKDKMSDTCYQLLSPAGFEYNLYLVEAEGKMSKVNPKSKKEIYLIFREALNNIVKHATGKKVEIELINKKGKLNLLIRNDSANNKNHSKSGQGLENMQFRANSIGAKLSIDHKPDHFEVRLSAPIS